MKEFLTTKEVAALMGCVDRTIREQVSKNQIEYRLIEGQSCGRGGKQYLIPLSALESKYQIKYIKQQKKLQELVTPTLDEEPCPVPQMTIEDCTAVERQEIAEWKQCLEVWHQYRDRFPKCKEEADELFIFKWNKEHPNMQISYRTLTRKQQALRESGDVGLLDKRGKALRGTTTIPSLAWAVFEDWYLDQSKLSIRYCYDLVCTWAQMDHPELLPLPSYSAFNRREKDIPYAVMEYFRSGHKALEDKALPYITRQYDDIESNDIWVADNHTIDVMSMVDGIEKEHRLYVTLYEDIRSRKWVGWYVTETPNSDANLFALKKAIERYGIPREIYTDNGREFLVRDIGGRGRRKTAKTDDHVPPTILERLGIKMTNAKVKNGRAKICERAFKELKEKFSKLFESYTGGHIKERPERLGKLVKSKKLVLDNEIREVFDAFADGWYNEDPQSGDGMNNKTPNQVYQENLFVKRTATQEDLNLMLMRHTNPQMVSRNGVKLKLYGQELNYWNDELIINHQKQKVYVRYNPEDLREVRIYDENDTYIMTVPCVTETILHYGASKEDIKTAASKINRVAKQIKAYKENRDIGVYEKADKLDVMLRKAKENISRQSDPESNVIEVVRANEKTTQPASKVVGDDYESLIDMQRMIENAKRRRNLNE